MQELFTTPDTVYHKLLGLLKEYSINKADIEELCFDAEVNYIADADMLRNFIDFPLEIDSDTFIAKLPCNISRIINIYKDDAPIPYTLIGNYVKFESALKGVLISYIGINVDTKGLPIIRSSHVPALITFCIKTYIEADMLIGKKPMGLFDYYDAKFSNQVRSLKQSWSHLDNETHNKIDAIRFNMLPMVAQNRLLHKIFK